MSSCLRVRQSTRTSTSRSSIAFITEFGAAGWLIVEISLDCSITTRHPPTPRSVWGSSWLTNQTTTLDHPPHFQDLALFYFCLFLRLEIVLKGTHFTSVEEIRFTLTRELRCPKKKKKRGLSQLLSWLPEANVVHKLWRGLPWNGRWIISLYILQ